MKTYTIEQIKKYLESQDSLGDIHHNLKNIDSILEKIEQEDEEFDLEREKADENDDYLDEIEQFKSRGYK